MGTVLEHDITGDVLLELDMNNLKEVDIIAFGKRMKISNAIAELRRPPSVASYNPPQSFAASASGHSRMTDEGSAGLSSAGMGASMSANANANAVPLGALYSPEIAPHTGDLVGTPLTGNGGGFADARNGRNRPASLALNLDDQQLAGKALLTGVSTSTSLSGSGWVVPESTLGSKDESTAAEASLLVL